MATDYLELDKYPTLNALDQQIESAERVGDIDPWLIKLIKEIHAYRAEIDARNIALKHAKNELNESYKKYFDLYELAPVAYFRLSRKGVVQECNLTGAQMLGVDRRLLKGAAFSRFISSDSIDVFIHQRRQLESGQKNANCELAVRRRDGEVIWVYIQFALVDAEPQADIRMVIIDITQRKQFETQLAENEKRFSYMASHDTLTGVANRALLAEYLERALESATRQHTKVGVLYIDLDGFKWVNDTLGHAFGDYVLTVVANRLHDTIRRSDSVGRLGGDEFAVIVPFEKDALELAIVAQKIIDALKMPIEYEQHQIELSASIGISQFPPDGPDAAALLDHADVAMANCKATGKNGYRFFTQALHVATKQKVKALTGLRGALEHDEFSLLYQPQYNLETGEMNCVEALLRWNAPGRGVIMPGQFLPVAEETGLILPISEWVLRTAFQDMNRWSQTGAPIRVAINVSPRLCKSTVNFGGMVERLLAEFAINPEALELELTESLFLDDINQAIRLFDRFKAIGAHISIDDFGTGYSSMNYLKQLPIDKLKIDRSFITQINDGPDDAAIAIAIIGLGHALNLGVLAEGVETHEQANLLRKHACSHVQGFLCSYPVTADAISSMLQQNHRFEFNQQH